MPPAPGAPAGTSPAVIPSAAVAGRFDEVELRRGKDTKDTRNTKDAKSTKDAARVSDRSAGAGASAAPVPDTTAPTYNLPRVLLALAAVVGLIFLLRWAARRFFGLPTARGASQVVQVLSRSVISPKQQLVLVKVGRRVVVAADNGSQLTSLSEITDPDEVAALVGQLRSEKDAGRSGALTGASPKAFGSVLGGVKTGYDADRPPDTSVYEEGGGDGELDEEDEAGPVDSPGYPGSRTGRDVYAPQGSAPAGDGLGGLGLAEQKVVAATRQELTGLLEKVRMVSDQFNRSRESAKAREGRPAGQ